MAVAADVVAMSPDVENEGGSLVMCVVSASSDLAQEDESIAAVVDVVDDADEVAGDDGDTVSWGGGETDGDGDGDDALKVGAGLMEVDHAPMPVLVTMMMMMMM